MIIAISDDSSIVKWKNNDKDEWKYAEISDLIKSYEKSSQGKWSITNETDEFYGRVYRCTHCGEEMLACGCRNFCTWCGADMKGDKE